MDTVREHPSKEDLKYWYQLLKNRKKYFLEAQQSQRNQAFHDLSSETTGELSKLRLHSADLASDTQKIETLESLLESETKTIYEIKDALSRLDKGVYGFCESCKKPISKKRLKVIPETRYCMECMARIENRQKQVNSEMASKQMPLPLEVVQFLKKISVSDLMQDNPITVNPNESLEAAVSLLFNNNFRHLPVVDDEGYIQGILSDRDLLGLVLKVRPWKVNHRAESSLVTNWVRDIMTKTPETASPNDRLFEAGSILIENKISCLPVVEGNRLVGILTESDFVKFIVGSTSSHPSKTD